MAEDREQEHLAWLESLARSVDEKYAKKSQELQELQQEVDRLRGERKALEQAVQAAHSELGLAEPKRVEAEWHTRFQGLSHGDAAEIAMREAGGRMRVVDMLEALRSGGKQLPDNAYQAVINTLNRDPRFRKVTPGEYVLANSEKVE